MNICLFSFVQFLILASRLLHTNTYPCFSIVAHQGSQQTVQLKLDRYTGIRNSLLEEKLIAFFKGPDEFLAEVINAVEHADQILQYDR